MGKPILQLTPSRLGSSHDTWQDAERQLGTRLGAGSRQGLREGSVGVTLGTAAFKVAAGCGGDTPNVSLLATSP